MNSTTNTLRLPVFTYLLIGMNVAFFAFIELTGHSTTNTLDLLDWGAHFTPFTFKHQWWRLVTSAFLHIGIWHLIINMYSLHVIGRDLEVNVGSAFFLVIYFLSALSAGLFSGYFNFYLVSAGASGAIFGLYGFDFVQILVKHRDDRQRVKRVAINFVVYLIVITAIGTQANFDNAGHYGGLTAGVLLSISFIAMRDAKIKTKLLIIGLAGSFLVFACYVLMPRSKVQYFDVFQTFIKTDEVTNRSMNQEYDNDSLMVDQLILSSAHWDTLIWRLDSIVGLPEELSSDTSILRSYVRLKQDEIGHVVKSVRQESYIYYDSIREVRSEISSLPKLSYPLNYSRPIDLPDTISEVQNILIPTKENYDSLWRETRSADFEYYREGSKDSRGRWEGFVNDYYKNGLRQMWGQYEHDLKDGVFIYYNENNTYSAAGRYVKDRKVGKWQYFYETGQMKSEIRYVDWVYILNIWDSAGNQMVHQGAGVDEHKYANGVTASFAQYVDGRIDGEQYGYHENGDLHFKEVYNRGEFLYGKAVALDGRSAEYDRTAYSPSPKGGWPSFFDYIKANQSLPKQLADSIDMQLLEVNFTVLTTGEIMDIRFINDLGPDVENEAKRLLLEGPKWNPALEFGLYPFTSDARIQLDFN